MITLETSGASALLAALRRIGGGQRIDDEDLEAVLDANAFFVNYYSGWAGSSRASVAAAMRFCYRPGEFPAGTVSQRLAGGFRQAAGDLALMERRLATLRQIDLSSVAGKVLRLLPENTPLESVIHLTVDMVNSAFAYNGEMGVSLLKGASSEAAFREVVSHELHHVGFGYWAAKDNVRQRLLAEESPRAVAVRHVQNLLMEGLANYYLTPGYVFVDASTAERGDPFHARLARLRREERAFFARAGDILVMSLDAHADNGRCRDAYQTIALDLEDFMLPAGHYLGARMVETLAQVHPHPQDAIVGCVQRLDWFLPMYNQAARRLGAFVFDDRAVEQFGALWCEQGQAD